MNVMTAGDMLTILENLGVEFQLMYYPTFASSNYVMNGTYKEVGESGDIEIRVSRKADTFYNVVHSLFKEIEALSRAGENK